MRFSPHSSSHDDGRYGDCGNSVGFLPDGRHLLFRGGGSFPFGKRRHQDWHRAAFLSAPGKATVAAALAIVNLRF